MKLRGDIASVWFLSGDVDCKERLSGVASRRFVEDEPRDELVCLVGSEGELGFCRSLSRLERWIFVVRVGAFCCCLDALICTDGFRGEHLCTGGAIAVCNGEIEGQTRIGSREEIRGLFKVI